MLNNFLPAFGLYMFIGLTLYAIIDDYIEYGEDDTWCFDVLFMPFAKEAYSDLSQQHKLSFQRLLTCEDPELFAWFMGHKTCPDPDLAEIVDVILKRVKL